jgi:3-oxoacyl-[acyl-carrier-protein] synthase III
VRTADMYIAGLGTHLPETVAIEWAAERGLYPADEVELHELASTAVAGDTPAPEMALQAAQEAVKRCGQDPSDLDLLVYSGTWHQGPEGWLPSSYLQRHLTGDKAQAVEVRQGCNSMFVAMEVAASYLRAEPQRQSALLVAADNYGTPLMDRWNMGPGYVGGDAATAMVLTKEPGFARLLSVCSATVPQAEQLHRGSAPLFPPGASVGRGPDFASRNEEFRQDANANGEGTTALIKIQQRLLDVIDQAVDEAGIALSDVTRVAFMNYSREIVEQRCMYALDLPMSVSTWEFGRTVGHCGASDQLLSLDHLVTTGELGPGGHMLMLGTGPGVTISCAIVEILQAPPWAG